MSAFFKQPSRSRLLGTLGTLAVSALVLSACATENPSTDSSSSASAPQAFRFCTRFVKAVVEHLSPGL